MKKKLNYIKIAVTLLSFGFIGWYVGTNIDFASFGVLEAIKIALFFAGFVVAFYAHITLHETGHLIGGLKGGYTFVSFCACGLCFKKENGKLKVSVEKHKNIGGYCKMLPPKNVSSKSFISHIEGGLFASLLITILSFVIFVLLYIFDKSGFAFMFFCGAFPLNFYLYCSNAVVTAISGTPADGMLVDMMKSGSPSAVATMKVLAYQGFLTSGYRPKDVPSDILDNMPLVSDDDVMAPIIYSNIFSYYLDKADEEKIFYYGKKLEDILPYVSEIYEVDIKTSVFLVACFEDNEEKAGKYYSELSKNLDKADSSLLLATAYYEKLFLSKDVSTLLDKARAAAKNELLEGCGKTIGDYADWLERL